MTATLTELSSLSTHDLYMRLLTTHSDDKPIKGILLLRHAKGDIPPSVKKTAVNGVLTAEELEIDAEDTKLTKTVKEAYIAGFRCAGFNNPDQAVRYMERLIISNKSDEEIARHRQTSDFWEMWKDRYLDWKLEQRRVA